MRVETGPIHRADVFAFDPTKVGFLAWECSVKMPGKPNQFYTVRAWTRKRCLKKANKAHADLLASYTYRSGLAKRGQTITEKVPEVPPDAPRYVDTDRPRPSHPNGIKPLEDEAVTAKVDNSLPAYVHPPDSYNIVKGERERVCSECRSGDWVAFSDSRGDLIISCQDCGKVQTSIKAL